MTKTSRHLFVAAALVTSLMGCSSMLPSSESSNRSAWPNFGEVKQSYDSLHTQKTTVDDLKKMKFHPGVNPQMSTLSQTDVLRRFYISNMPSEFIDKGVYACLAAQQKCEAYEVDIRQINKQRVGNAALDLTSFKRNTEISGWRFSAVFLIHDGVLVYKTWGGQAEVSEKEFITNPLGPVQNMGPQLISPYIPGI